MTFQENIIKRRKMCGLSQEQVALAIGVSTRMYQNYEAGKHTPNIIVAQRIADALDIKLEALLRTEKPSKRAIVTSQGKAYSISKELANLIKYEPMDEDSVVDCVKMINDAFFFRTRSNYYESKPSPTSKTRKPTSPKKDKRITRK